MSDENTHVAAAAEPVKPPAKRWWAVLQREDWIVVGWVMGIKVLLFIFGAKSFRILENKPLPSREGWLAGHLESLGFASLFASRAIWLQRGQRNESMVLPAFPLVHSLSRLCRQSQLSCQRLYCFRLFFYRRGNFPAKNRPVRPQHADLALGGLVFPHLSDRLLLAHRLQ